MSKKSTYFNFKILLKSINHHLSIQRDIIFLQQLHQRSLITDHHNKYNANKSLKYCKNSQDVTQTRSEQMLLEKWSR